jgi:hypothetical protein
MVIRENTVFALVFLLKNVKWYGTSPNLKGLKWRKFRTTPPKATLKEILGGKNLTRTSSLNNRCITNTGRFRLIHLFITAVVVSNERYAAYLGRKLNCA